MRLLEGERQRAVRLERRARRKRGRTVARHRQHGRLAAGKPLRTDEVDLVGDEPERRELVGAADDDRVRRRIDAGHIARFGRARRQTATLTDREVRDPGVRSYQRSVTGADFARRGGRRREPREDVAVVSAFDEANVLRLGFVGDRQTEPCGVPARCGFVAVAQRKQESGQLLGR